MICIQTDGNEIMSLLESSIVIYFKVVLPMLQIYFELSMACEGNMNGNKIGQNFVLPSSYIGSPRDMRQRYLNALALVSEYGKPDFFITMTCNPNWPEIRESLLPDDEAQNRSDLVARVFRARNEELKNELIKRKLLE
ncbi:hypothetical protein OROMI_018582 [Orobanche minor]